MISTDTAHLKQLFYPAPQDVSALAGLPHLMEMVFREVSLVPVGQALIGRSHRDPADANALMDLSCVMFLTGHPELAARMQDDALAVSRRYTLPAEGVPQLRVLVIKTRGALMDSMPIEFLLHGSAMTLEMVYVDGDDAATVLDNLPPHDVACIGVCESPTAVALLERLADLVPTLPCPTLNDPRRIANLARETVWRSLASVPGCLTPPTARVNRSTLDRLAGGSLALSDVLPGATFPLICRPCGSHAGHGLDKIDDALSVTRYLAAKADNEFFISPFVDYVSADQQYRKYRIAFVGGRPFPVHMALSARWMVHYLNGDMTERADNRATEQQFFDRFEQEFGQRHAQALAEIDARLGLDYFSIDCGETADGRLLVFECDIGGVVHAMDPLDKFGYKRAHMLRIFAAFRALLMRIAHDPARLKSAVTPAAHVQPAWS